MVPPRSALLGFSSLLLAVAPAGAVPIGSVYKVVRSGALVPMGFHYYLETGCRSPVGVVVNLVTPPQHGEVSEGARNAHPSYDPRSALAACNRLKVPGLEVYYRSVPGYTGPDSYVVERVFPNGDAQRFRIEVSVR